jgi:nucleoside-diphosphate-sugar epimerase
MKNLIIVTGGAGFVGSNLIKSLLKKTLIDGYNNTLIFLKNDQKHQPQDISIKINNHLIYYEREISDKIAYLKEQSVIAKKLGSANIWQSKRILIKCSNRFSFLFKRLGSD